MNSSSNSLSSLCRKRKAVETLSMIDASKRDRFLSTYHRQNYDLPDSIMFYIAMNPATLKVYQSLIKTCKYFFFKNPIIVLTDAYCDGKKWRTFVNVGRCSIVDLKKFTSKLWFIGTFNIRPIEVNNKNVIYSLIPRMYQFDAKLLCIQNQILAYDEYVYLSASAEIIDFYNVTVNDKNGSIVALEKLVESASTVRKFIIISNTTYINITAKTAKALFENPDFSRLECFCLSNVPHAFDIEAFYEYMKKNTKTNFDLYFDDTISDAYKARLNAIVDEILEAETFDYKPPIIGFNGIDEEKYSKLHYVY